MQKIRAKQNINILIKYKIQAILDSEAVGKNMPPWISTYFKKLFSKTLNFNLKKYWILEK